MSVELEDTGERMIPHFHRGRLIYAEHVIRYRAAAELVRDRVVLDIASGSGYGAAILAETATRVVGVDVDPNAVDYATEQFGSDTVEFLHGSAERIPLDDDSVDIVTTFETIEHIHDYRAFLREIRRVLKPEGIAIVSTPNDAEFAVGNHFHIHQFLYDEFCELLKGTFPHVDEYFQATWKHVAIGSLVGLQEERPEQCLTNFAPVELGEVLYFYFLCSDVELRESPLALAALGERYSDRLLSEREARMRSLSESYDAIRGELATLKIQAGHMTRELADIKGSRSFRLARRIAGLRPRRRI